MDRIENDVLFAVVADEEIQLLYEFDVILKERETLLHAMDHRFVRVTERLAPPEYKSSTNPTPEPVLTNRCRLAKQSK